MYLVGLIDKQHPVDSFAILPLSFQMDALQRGQRIAAAAMRWPPHAVDAENAKPPPRDSIALVKLDSPADTVSTVSPGLSCWEFWDERNILQLTSCRFNFIIQWLGFMFSVLLRGKEDNNCESSA